MMKKIILGLLAVTALLTFNSCDSSSDPEDDPVVAVYSDFLSETGSIIEITKKTNQLLGDTVDSLEVTNVRILISRIMLHPSKNNEGDDKTLKINPVVFTADINSGEIKMTDAIMPEGSYDKIKFELHRFSESERINYTASTIFADFATEDRYSVIIEGKYWDEGQEHGFKFNGTVTANLTLDFETALVLDDNSLEKVVINIDPNELLFDGTDYLNPDENKNENDIENLIKEAFSVKIWE